MYFLVHFFVWQLLFTHTEQLITDTSVVKENISWYIIDALSKLLCHRLIYRCCILWNLFLGHTTRLQERIWLWMLLNHFEEISLYLLYVIPVEEEGRKLIRCHWKCSCCIRLTMDSQDQILLSNPEEHNKSACWIAIMWLKS